MRTPLLLLLGLALISGTVALAQPDVGRPMLFIHGFCDTSADWSSYSSVQTVLMNHVMAGWPSLYTDPSVWVLYYDGRNHVVRTHPQGLPALTTVPSSARFFLIDFFDEQSYGGGSAFASIDVTQVAQISILHKADEVAQVIQAIAAITKVKDVVVFGHSMGGLPPRAYLENYAVPYDTAVCTTTDNYACLQQPVRTRYTQDVAKLITLDTPHGGAATATWNLFVPAGCITADTLNKRELADGSYLIDQLNQNVASAPSTVPLTAIRSYTSPGWPAWMWAPLPDPDGDEIVTLAEQGIVAIAPTRSNYHDITNYFGSFSSFYPGLVPFPPLHMMVVLGSERVTQTSLQGELDEILNTPAQTTSIAVQAVAGVGYTLTGPTTLTGTGQQTFYSVPVGTYTLTYTGGGPTSNAIIKPSAQQTLGVDHSSGSNTWALAYTITFGAGPAAPAVTTGVAGSIGTNSATLSGTANPNGSSATAWFEWSSDSGLASPNTTPSQSIGAGTSAVRLTANLSGLNAGTVYYYRAVATNGGGASRGTIRNFTTLSFSGPPSAPVLLAPANGVTGAPVAPMLGWLSATGATSYDVYFGTQATPPLAGTTSDTDYVPGTLNAQTTYYWRIVAKNSAGSASSGTWSFSTGAAATGLRFIAVTPCRVADTRDPNGTFGGPVVAANTERSFAIPQSACGIPTTAQAYSLNVTVVPRGPLAYLTLWPTGQARPTVSTLNSWGGTVVANAAIMPAGTGGAVSVYATNPTDVIIDINGYFDTTAAANAYSFYAATPCRIADTRNPAGPFGGPRMSAGQSRNFAITSSSCGILSGASAYSLNVTVVPDPAVHYLGYLTAWPAAASRPNVSTLNSWIGKVAANAAIVPAGASGAISVYVTDPTDVILDTNGYFAAPGASNALKLYPVAPCRVADTRGPDGPFGGPILEANTVRSLTVPASSCLIPATAAAYSVNVTVVPDGPLSYLTAWPAGAVRPGVSTLNSFDGAVVANAAIVPAGQGGAVSVYVTNRTHVIVDINGYFAP